MASEAQRRPKLPRRKFETNWRVKWSDWLSRVIITIGGWGTIIAVTAVFVCLFAVVVPLFFSATLSKIETSPRSETEQSIRSGMDEYEAISWSLYPSGKLKVFALRENKLLDEQQLFTDTQLTSSSFALGYDDAVLGFEDGTLRMAAVGIETHYLKPEEVPSEMRGLAAGDARVHGKGVIERTPVGQYRLQTVAAKLGPPIKATNSPIVLLDHVSAPHGGDQIRKQADPQRTPAAPEKPVVVPAGTGVDKTPLAEKDKDKPDAAAQAHIEVHLPESPPVCILVDADGNLLQCKFRVKASPLDDEEGAAPNYTAQKFKLEYLPHRDLPPAYLKATGSNAKIQNLFVIWQDGHFQRIDMVNSTSDDKQQWIAEKGDLVPGVGNSITALDFLLGRETLICGDSQGNLTAWFTAKWDGEPATLDKRKLYDAHHLPKGSAAVTCLGMSQRTRSVAVGYADGSLKVCHVTTNRALVSAEVQQGEPIEAIQFSPKETSLLAWTPSTLWQAEYDPGYPEISFRSLFLPVWYESYSQPEYMWQSSSGSEDSELKYSVTPLIFGTLKATFYSLLFGAPLALLAAIYTSEFVHPRLKSKIKPGIEMMASLPSVVLGFLAAQVLTPLMNDRLQVMLASFLTVPFSLMLGAYLWHLLPQPTAQRLQRFRILFIVLAIPVGLALASLLGGPLEDALFGGNLVNWLDGAGGVEAGTGGWMILLMPLSIFGTLFLNLGVVNPHLRKISNDWPRSKFALINAAKFIAFALLAVLLAYLAGFMLTSLGFDPRGSWSILNKYEQRNSLVVGFVMGFAIIPIIYTIAEDALASVPPHLRSASLGAGATPWQTATRVVIPAAMSGLFSALMIGLGRAIGETMIVLMATGNTAVMEMNLFNGFRTLAANIATEISEAANGSTHYRVLFLTALALFLITFCVNTVAELIRIRYRNRFKQL